MTNHNWQREHILLDHVKDWTMSGSFYRLQLKSVLRATGSSYSWWVIIVLYQCSSVVSCWRKEEKWLSQLRMLEIAWHEDCTQMQRVSSATYVGLQCGLCIRRTSPRCKLVVQQRMQRAQDHRPPLAVCYRREVKMLLGSCSWCPDLPHVHGRLSLVQPLLYQLMRQTG